MKISEYRVGQFVADHFDDYPYYAVDFTSMLQPNICLNKKVYRISNGRPDYAEYLYGSDVIAIRFWTFIDDASELNVYYKEELAYILLDGTTGEKFTIKEWTAQAGNDNDMVYMADERSRGRRYIIDQLKIIVYGTLLAVYPSDTSAQTATRAGEFFNYHDSGITRFIEAGDRGISTDISNDSHVDHQLFLDAEVSVGVSVRAAIASKINY